MNIDVLKNNPSWTSYFYIAIPLFCLVMFSVQFLRKVRTFMPVNGNKPVGTSVVQWLLSAIRKFPLGDTSRRNAPDPEKAVFDKENRRALICAAKHGWADKFKDPLPLHLQDQSLSRQLLVAAACGGQLSVVKILIQRNKSNRVMDVSEMNSQVTETFHTAVEAGHVDVVEFLLREEARLDGQHGLTLLQAAVRGGHMDVVKVLLQKGVNVVGVAGYELLHAAVTGGHTHIMEILFQKVNIEGPTGGRTALQIAAEKGHRITACFLLKYGAVLNGAAVYDVLLASAKTGNMGLLNMLYKEYDSKSGEIAMHPYSKRKAREAKGQNIKHNKQYSLEPSERHTELQYAASFGHTGIVNILLEEGANVNAEPG